MTNPYTQFNEAPPADVADDAAGPAQATADSNAAGVRLYVFPLEAVRAVQRHYSDCLPMRLNHNTDEDS
jgi:hypothetical protein